jgi:uncharacterized protein YjbI with pentapeptide repeats
MQEAKRKFKYRKLEDCSFRSRNLTGQDFSYADIRGINFNGAALRNANFSYVRAGQSTSWMIVLTLSLIFLTALVGIVAGFVGVGIGTLILLGEDLENLIFGIPVFTVLIVLVGLLLWRGLDFVLITSISIITLIATLIMIRTDNANVAVLVLFLTFLVAVVLLNSIAGAIALAGTWLITKKITILFSSVTILGSAFTTIKLFSEVTHEAILPTLIILSDIISFSVTIINILLCAYIAWRSLCLDYKYLLVYKFALNITSFGGTSFQSADLTGANFTQAILEKTDFRKACLSGACWFRSLKIEQARVDKTYLEDVKIRDLVVTLDGQNGIFEDLNLRYLNLQNSNLQNASFIGADLSDVNLRRANLFGAKLARTQLYQADLRGACLTGAYIQDWGVSTNTQLGDIECEYIFMRLPNNDNPDPCRKPDDRDEKFAPGDFTDFIFPYIDRLRYYTQQNEDPRELGKKLKESLDLYHRSDFNAFAALIALRKLAIENPDAQLDIVSLEILGTEKVQIKIAVKGQGNRAELVKAYKQHYVIASSSSKQDIRHQAELLAKEDVKLSRLVSIFALPIGDNTINISVGRDLSGVLNIGTIGELSVIS